MGEGGGGGVEVALDALALEVADDHVVGAELVVVNAGRLDHKETRLGVELGGVAPSEDDQPVLGQVHVRLVDLLAQFLEHHCFVLLSHMFLSAN